MAAPDAALRVCRGGAWARGKRPGKPVARGRRPDGAPVFAGGRFRSGGQAAVHRRKPARRQAADRFCTCGQLTSAGQLDDRMAEVRVSLEELFDFAATVRDGGMVAAAEVVTDAFDALAGETAGEVHGDVAGGDHGAAARALRRSPRRRP